MSPRLDRASLRNRLISAGLCEKCCAQRGEHGTKTLCRPCADKKARKVRDASGKPKLGPRSEAGKALRVCENCFALFEPGSGLAVFCEPCSPWFEDGADVAINLDREYEQARKAKAVSAASIIAGWLRDP